MLQRFVVLAFPIYVALMGAGCWLIIEVAKAI